MVAKMLRLAAAVVIMAALFAGGLNQPAFASDPLADACQGADAKKSATCGSLSPNSSPLTGTNGLLYKASIFLSSIAGVIAIVVILISGFRYMTAAGDSQKATSARKTLIGAIIGLVIIALAQTIITFIVRIV